MSLVLSMYTSFSSLADSQEHSTPVPGHVMRVDPDVETRTGQGSGDHAMTTEADSEASTVTK